MRLRTILMTLLLTLPFQVGCDFDAFAESDRYTEDFQYTYDLRPGARVSLETFNGSVEILSWEKDQIQITGSKYAGQEENMKAIKIDVQASADSVQIRAIRPQGIRGNMGAKFFLRLPRKVQLERIASSNGQIRVEDIEGNGRLETSNGGIRLRKVDGQLIARTSNGGIEGYGLEGSLQARTTNAGIRLEDVRGTVEAESSNGSINVQQFVPKPGSPVRLTTSNASIDVAIEKLEGDVRAATSNSSVTIRLPGDVKARLEASTSNSSIQSDFEVMTSGTISKTRLEGSINGGGPLVHLTSSNGSIRINRM